MTYLEEKSFNFRSLSPKTKADTFAVVNFTGREAISTPYEFTIKLVTGDADVDLEDVLNNGATLYLRPDKKLPIHGVLASLELESEIDGNYFYTALLVPHLWQLTMFDVSEVYLDMTVPEILEQVLREGGLGSKDYDLRLMREYRRWSYVCQYQETHLNFLSRWMEREGICYFFDQGEDQEKLIITDTAMAHKDLPDDKSVNYVPPSGLDIWGQKQAVTAFLGRQHPVPRKVTLQDFNHRCSPPTITGEAEVSSKGRGELHIYGEHVKDNDEATAYAKLRAQELLCRQRVYHGEGAANFLRVGWHFELARHFKDAYNRKYLLTALEHHGSQAAILLPGVGAAVAEGERKPYYTNSFEAIEDDIQFRPERKTPRPRFYGTINAKVSAEGSGQYAEIDEYGRYKVKLPFDRSDRAGQKASSWIRMAQPFAGPDEGMHFPLRKGAEVLLTFMDGDPDRPIIASAVPSAEGQSIIVDKNATKNMIKTSGGNYMHFEDLAGKQRILMSSPTADSWVRVGAPNDPIDPLIVVPGDSIATYTDGTGTWRLLSSAGAPVPSRVAAAADNNASLKYRLTKNFYVARHDTVYKIFSASPAASVIEGTSVLGVHIDDPLWVLTPTMSSHTVGSTHTLDGKDWTLGAAVTVANNSSQSLAFYREKTVALKVQKDLPTDANGIRIRSAGNIWTEAYNRYADYRIGGPTEKDRVPSSLQYLWDKFYASTPAFAPTGMLAYKYGEGVPNPVSASDLASMSALARRGKVQLAMGDTFNVQEGNIYDFGGYWNYNLGNSYLEAYMPQSGVELNATLDRDRADKGGPNYTKISGIDSHGANVWVTKKIGTEDGRVASYDFATEMDTLEVKNNVRAITYKYNSHTTDYAYDGDGFIFSEIDDEVATGIRRETVTHPGGAVYKFDFVEDHIDHYSQFAWSMQEKQSAEFALGVAFSFKFEGNAGIAVSVSVNLKADFEIANGLTFKLSTGLAMDIDLDLKLGTGVEIDNDGKLTFKAVGFRARKEALLEAKKNELRLESIEAKIKDQRLMLSKSDFDLRKCVLHLNNSDLHFDL
jgi:type VI secretion system VgrG family protein